MRHYATNNCSVIVVQIIEVPNFNLVKFILDRVGIHVVIVHSLSLDFLVGGVQACHLCCQENA